LDYFTAVQEGRRRVTRAMGVLQELAGPSHPVLFLKMGMTDWTPVGEEMLWQVLPGKDGTQALVICDSDGNSKAMSGWLAPEKAAECSRTLEQRGVPQFSGELKLPI
jgi:hypothetical protein